jgi:hypothetical protein
MTVTLFLVIFSVKLIVKSINVLCPDRFDILADTLERSGWLVGFTHVNLITVYLSRSRMTSL